MSESGHEHRKQNREVPYPTEALQQHNALENYFVDVINSDVPDFETLPDSFTSGALDTYASWVAELTANDPQHRERSSFIFYNPKKQQFIFPPNPLLGDEFSAKTLITNSPGKNYPLVRVHSHPDSTAFSTTDIKRSLRTTGFWSSNYNDSIAELLGTYRGNYLVLTTAQSQFFPPDEVDELANYLNSNISNAIAGRHAQQATLLKDLGLSEQEIVDFLNRLNKKEHEIFGSDISTLATTVNYTALLASKFQFGFYYSEGNGKFEKHTPERIHELKLEADQLFYDMVRKI